MDFIGSALKSVRNQLGKLKPPIVVIIAIQVEGEDGRRYIFEERVLGSRKPKNENDALIVIFRRQALEAVFRQVLASDRRLVNGDFLVRVGCEDEPGGTALAEALHEALSNSRKLL